MVVRLKRKRKNYGEQKLYNFSRAEIKEIKI